MTTPTKPYVIWVDHGTEGWQPREFDTLEEIRDYLLSGQSYGSTMVLTRLLKVRIGVDEA